MTLAADRIIDSEDRFNRVIGRAGGWAHVNYVVRGWAEKYPRAWAVIVDHARWANSKIDEVSLKSIAEACHVSRNSAYRIIQSFPQEMAVAIMNTPVGNELQLSAAADSDAV
jgi:hypothetical protein